MKHIVSLNKIRIRVGIVRDQMEKPYDWPVMWNEAIRQLMEECEGKEDIYLYLRHKI